MGNWWKTAPGNYINGDMALSMFAVQVGSDWIIQTQLRDEEVVNLNGTYTSQAEAQEAIRELVGGYDPAVVVA